MPICDVKERQHVLSAAALNVVVDELAVLAGFFLLGLYIILDYSCLRHSPRLCPLTLTLTLTCLNTQDGSRRMNRPGYVCQLWSRSAQLFGRL